MLSAKSLLHCLLYGLLWSNPAKSGVFYYPFDTTFDIEGSVDNSLDDIDQVTPEVHILSVSKRLGQVAGLAINSKGNLVAFHRANRVWNQGSFDYTSNKLDRSLGPIMRNTLYVINGTGGLIEEHGKGMFFMPHGLAIDRHDNIYVTDVGLHQVLKMDKNFKVVFELGEKFMPGSDNHHFCMPTDVAVASTGDFFVADGYCNARIMKFNKNGTFIASFESNFRVPHSIALIEDMNMICVADRENERIQCFAAGMKGGLTTPAGNIGKPITKAENIGPVYAIREKS